MKKLFVVLLFLTPLLSYSQCYNIGNFSSNSTIGSSVVDLQTLICVPQTTTGIVVTMGPPTSLTTGKNITVTNIGTVSFTCVPGGIVMPQTGVIVRWTGATSGWIATGGAPTTNPEQANRVLSGPSSGSPALPTFRMLTASDIPSLPQYALTSSLSTVATTGVYSDLVGKPVLFSGAYNDLTGKPTLFSGAYNDLTGKPTLSTVATTGAYSDLAGKPTLFSGSYLDLTNKPTLFSGAYADLTGKPTFATIATTGNYTDLIGRPTSLSQFTNDIPFASASNTITFTNKSGNISQWTNDAGYKSTITSSDITTGLGYTPATNSRVLTINGSSQDLSTNRTWSVGTVTSIGLTSSDLTVGGASPITTSGSYTLTLPTVNANIGTFNNVTINAKGLATAGSNIAYLTGNQTITLSGDVTGSGATAITTTLSMYSVVPIPIAAGARNFNQAYQISATRPSKISVSSDVACTLSLTSGTSGQAILEISPNGTSGWIYCGQVSGSNTGTLTIGLNTTQITGGTLDEDLPIGYYWRIRTNNVTGTATYTFNGGNYRIY